jgi:FtsP/CotA-like multicopper oxidase with cupredoxin domain
MLKLGELPPETHPAVKVGEVALNRFTIFITAEADARVSAPAGTYVLRGMSPSMRLSAPHVVQVGSSTADHAAHNIHNGWHMPLPHPRASDLYMPSLVGMTPNATPFLPHANENTVPPVKPRSLLKLADGSAIRLEARLVKRVIRGQTVLLYAFNGQQPGPLIDVSQGATIHVTVVNRAALPTAIHWHGVRLDNRHDGVPHVTQELIEPGDSFRYTVRFPDAGIFWYHAHHREDVLQDLGLYGNIIVRGNVARAQREAVIMLDDVLFGEDGMVDYGAERATHALMGRFGNTFLVNGAPTPWYRLNVKRGAVVRFFLTNTASTRTFNVSFPGARMKLVGGDVGRFEHEEWIDNVVIAPAERYMVDVAFDSAGVVPLINSVQAIDHTLRRFFPEQDTLGVVHVGREHAPADANFGKLQSNADVINDVARYRPHFERAPDITLTLSMKDQALPFGLVQLLRTDTLYFNPVEWSGTMTMMDWLPTTDQVTWLIRDAATGLENEAIKRRFKTGDVVRIRLVNDRHTLHAMAHPIHIHGQRFLVLSVNGRATRNYVWKDTVLVPVGSVVELLLEVSNPGMWMLHCHIAEHLEAGMKTVFTVQ